MKLITTTAIALIAALSAAPAAAQSKGPETAQAQVKLTPSKGAMKALVELQDAVNKNDFANVPAKAAAAQAVATTKEDKYLIAQLQLKAALASKNDAAMAAAIDGLASSGYLDAAKSAELYMSLGSTLFNSKQYAQAQAAFQKAATTDPRNSEATAMIGEALFAQGQKAQAAAAFQRALQAKAGAGQKPDEPLYKRAVAIAYEAQSPTAVELARQWVAAYPSPASWRDSVAIYRNLTHPDVEGIISLYRLLNAAGAINSGADYALYARAAAEQNNFNEAQAALDAGIAAKLIDPSKSEYSDLVQGLKSKPKATAADLAAATKSAQSGMALLRIGDRYAAMGDYSKAVELYRSAMGKPGVDAGVANLHIGMALARSGDKAGATTAFNAVTGPMAGVAKFWLTYLNTKA